jgi:hypothetical protein
MTYRIIMTIMIVVVAGLALGSATTLTAAAHDRPLHRTYACQFAKDFRQEVHLPPAPCHTPG